jgi:hypothetical protein
MVNWVTSEKATVDERAELRWSPGLRFSTVACLLLVAGSIKARTDLELLPGKGPWRVIGGQEQRLTLVWRNATAKPLRTPISTRVYQASSATTAPVQVTFWKWLQIAPGQTILDSAIFEFPPVRGETPFLIQWIEGTNGVVGITEASVYPPDLLKELAALAGQKPIAVFDPAGELKPLLKKVNVPFSDIELSGFDNFEPILAVLGPFESKAQMREGLAGSVKAMARKGAAVVWLQPPPGPHDQLQPSYFSVPDGKGVIVVAQGLLVANLAEDPQSQLNLIHICRVALRPKPPRLPDLVSQP